MQKGPPAIRFGLTLEQEREVLKIGKRMFEGVKPIRQDYEGDWRELGKYFCPHLVRFDETKTKRSKWSNIINNTCLTAVRTFQAGMQSGLTNQAKQRFKVGLEDFELMEYQPARDWLELVTKRQQAILRRSNFYTASKMLYTVYGVLGTAGMLQLSDFEDVMQFQNLMTGRYWIGLNAKKRVDRLFVEMRLTVIQQVEMFTLAKCSAAVRSAYDRGDYFLSYVVMVGIFPNPFVGWARDPSQIIFSNQKKFVSVYWTEGHAEALKTSGYDRFPAQVPRMEVTDDEAYGIGCGIMAIGDTKAIQLKEREKAKGLQKIVSPPTSAPAEMRNGQFPVSGLPGSVTYRPPQSQADSIKTLYEVNLPLNYLKDDIIVDEDRVNKAFYVDLFMAITNSVDERKTAFETARLHEEQLQGLGPVVEQLNTEWLDQNIERGFEIMDEADLIPPPPPELQGKTLKIEYVGILAQAQQMVGIGNIEKLMTFATTLSEVFPNAPKKIDAQQAIDEVGMALGVPSRIIISDDKVAEQEAADQKQAQQMQLMQAAQVGVDAVQKLGNTPLGESTALNQMAGQA